MTATQSFKIYEVLQRRFKNNNDAKIFVQEIEEILEAKLESKMAVLSAKEDLLKFQVDVEKRFNNIILWIVGTGIAEVGLIFSIVKLFIIK